MGDDDEARLSSSSDLKALDPLPEDKRSPGLSKVGLRSHGLDYWLSAIQKYTTGPPSIFVALHLTNTSLIPLVTRSVPASEPYLLLTRELYQAPILEPVLLIGPILAHIGSGIALRCLRSARHARRYGDAEIKNDDGQGKGVRVRSWKTPSVQARLGYTLMPLLGAHVLVNRAVPLAVDGGSSSVGLGYVAHGFARAPWLMTSSYVVLVGVGVWHIVGGWAWWTGWWKGDAPGFDSSSVIQHAGPTTSGANAGYLGSDTAAGSEALRRRKRIRWTVSGIVVAGAGLWLAGGLGVIGRGGWGAGWEVKNWEAIYSQVPLLGRYIVSSS